MKMPWNRENVRILPAKIDLTGQPWCREALLLHIRGTGALGTASSSRVKPPLRVSRRASSSGHSAVSRPQPVPSQPDDQITPLLELSYDIVAPKRRKKRPLLVEEYSLVSHTAASQDSKGVPRRVRQIRDS